MGEDDEVVAVQMDGVGGGNYLLCGGDVLAGDDEPDVALGEVV